MTESCPRYHFSRRFGRPIEARPCLAASGLLRKEGAPALRADFPLDHFAGVRRLEIVTPVAALCTFRLILVRDRVLRHLGLCGRKTQAEAMDDRSAKPIGRHAPEKNTSWKGLSVYFGTDAPHAIRSVRHSLQDDLAPRIVSTIADVHRVLPLIPLSCVPQLSQAWWPFPAVIDTTANQPIANWNTAESRGRTFPVRLMQTVG
jgi:hypothetical protein